MGVGGLCQHPAVVPSPSRSVPPASRLQTPARTLGAAVRTRRLIAWAVLLFVVAHALWMPAQRTVERAHFHLGRPPALDVEAMRRAAPPLRADLASWLSPAPGLFRHQVDPAAREQALHAHGPELAHGHLAVHEHAAGRGDVVYVDVDRHESTPGTHTVLKRMAVDLDAVLRPEPAPSVGPRSPLPDAAWAADFNSRTELPLERPPRRLSVIA
jgi:hypothetical protein